VLVAPQLPSLLKTDDNPEGISRSVFDGITARIAADRPAAMKDFMDRSSNVDLLGSSRISDQAWQKSFYAAISASAHAALSCVTACLEDFREDLARINIPILVIQGDQDRVLPTRPPARGFPRC
jgi:non-heme chloroperoxidase